MIVCFLIFGLVFILTLIPLRLGRIPPNSFYGIRIPKAFESRELWYKVNAAGAGIMIVYGAAMLVVSVVLFLISSKIDLDSNVVLIGLFSLITLAIAHVIFVCNKI